VPLLNPIGITLKRLLTFDFQRSGTKDCDFRRAGFAIGDHYQNQAIAQINSVHQQEHQLKELQPIFRRDRTGF
jgi:hypothetical protein